MLLDLPALKHPPFEYLLGAPLKYKQGVFILITSWSTAFHTIGSPRTKL